MIDVRDRVLASTIINDIRSIAEECRCSTENVVSAIQLLLENRHVPAEVEEYVLKVYASRPDGCMSMKIVREALTHTSGITSTYLAQLNIESIMRLCVVADAAEALATGLNVFDEGKARDTELCFNICAQHTEYKTKSAYTEHMSELITEALSA